MLTYLRMTETGFDEFNFANSASNSTPAIAEF
jgi:hypothetical protein